ncbi:MotE family protein [Evansella clarkii]|uniref:MotE family protein n=1 Tax=Evansella clarkii TaxID=79879 RepID=UPI000998C757|nr:hypothetical protein [Evansella clarkii]
MSGDQEKSKFQWFFIVIFIPAVFVMILAVVLMYYTGVNVGGAVREAASVLPFIDSDEESHEEYSSEELTVRLEHENENYAKELARLEMELESKEEEIMRLEEELLLLNQEEEHGDDYEAAEEDVNRQDIRDIVRTLESMTASKAADILEEMSEDEAAGYLRQMNIDKRAQILSRMDPETAASLVNQLAE